MITNDRTGGRTVHLFIPFELGGKRIEQITLGPLRFGHVLRWSAGDWQTMVDFLVELAGVEEAVIRELRYPDADRVIEAFMALLTPEIRNDIATDSIPQKRTIDRIDDLTDEITALTETVNAKVRESSVADLRTNGPLQGPGDPLPPIDTNPGFDLSEEP